MQSTEVENDQQERVSGGRRELLREVALQNAMRKRAQGVPTYTVPEAAALLSLSQEYLYQLIKADCFPALWMRIRGRGRFAVPAKVVETMLDRATAGGRCFDVSQFAAETRVLAGGAA